MPADITIKAKLRFEHVDGPEQDAETVLDYFAGTVGRENAAAEPLVLEIRAGYDEKSHYVLKLVD